jgi:hypothetical protein
MPLFMAFLYQSTLMCGMEGGFRLKEPEMEKCGSLMCGRLQLKLKMLFSLFTMPCTKDHTPLNTDVKVDLIPFKMLLTVDFTAFNPEDTAVLMEFTTVVMVVLIPFQTVDAAARRWGREGNYVAGANIAGFLKVAEAMTAQGIV